jgi:hypothetical protein
VTSVSVNLNQVKDYELPAYSDPEGMPITLSYSGINTFLMNSITVSADKKNLTFNPTDFSLPGEHTVDVIIADGQPLSSRYTLTVTVLNTPPYFLKAKPVASLSIRLNAPSYYALPAFQDDEGHEIFLITTSPQLGSSFITQDENAGYKIEPKDPTKDIGTFQIVGYLTDKVSA